MPAAQRVFYRDAAVFPTKTMEQMGYESGSLGGGDVFLQPCIVLSIGLNYPSLFSMSHHPRTTAEGVIECKKLLERFWNGVGMTSSANCGLRKTRLSIAC
jgi:hypothetical protein